ncbi:class I SAM-dependent methyltransferase [Calothrix sp. PCC 7507]|uniref:class I SAM-dependent methyltransferase n=1 Tax=Calothrix sp. PCC 7507 TaxID=99598 RepID=UPI00029EE588|nr:class I SAM-dependent methyltransferase [Calothrix sp. PCC 7507]AFY32503.1 Methyltransferase type 12 [Calothrix sp. PCC 7507]
MNTQTISYSAKYFQSRTFETDYQTLAAVIFELYHPQTVAEFGCGPGHLSRELAKLGVKVTSVDGHSQPSFTGLAVEFHHLDLNDPIAIANFFANKHFDLAICLEVAEHLQPQSSPILVKWLTSVAPVVIFSAAVPHQGGHGHINLQPREYWHNEFMQRQFIAADRVREELRATSSIAPWYRYNVIDYVQIQHPQAPNPAEVIPRLIASESAAASAYYEEYDRRFLAELRLKYAPVQLYASVKGLRFLAKRLLGRS